jgi:hypothetical protein
MQVDGSVMCRSGDTLNGQTVFVIIGDSDMTAVYRLNAKMPQTLDISIKGITFVPIHQRSQVQLLIEIADPFRPKLKTAATRTMILPVLSKISKNIQWSDANLCARSVCVD